jgi:hypothetical protein
MDGDADTGMAADSDTDAEDTVTDAEDTVTDAEDTHLALVADTQDAELTAERLAVMRVAELEALHRRHAVDSAAAGPVVALVAAELVEASAAAATAVAAADTGN